jgi:DNA-binding transcriptional ArsR family regulator
MSQNPIVPEKITKPIQLLGAWLAGLFAIDSCFLFAASRMEAESFESIALVCAAIANVPIFLVAVFLLQTRFRPELQEDSYYATYLSQKTNQPIPIEKDALRLEDAVARIELLEPKPREIKSALENEADVRFVPSHSVLTSILRTGTRSNPNWQSVGSSNARRLAERTLRSTGWYPYRSIFLQTGSTLDENINARLYVCRGIIVCHRRRAEQTGHLELLSSERSVGEIERELRLSQPSVSKHLRVLREAGFV